MTAAQKAMRRGLAVVVVIACLWPASAHAEFGIKDMSVTALNRDGSIARSAGSHPYEFTVGFDLNTHADLLETPEGRLRTIVVDLPTGMVGNPLATPRCTRVAFDVGPPACPPGSNVGIVRIAFNTAGGVSNATIPVYNLTPTLGSAATIGFNADGIDTFQEALVRTGSDYGVSIADFAVPTELEIRSVKETIWGVPMDSAHDSERFCAGDGPQGCKTEAAPASFLTLPTSCGAPLATTVHVESVEKPGAVVSKTAFLEDEDGHPVGPVDCGSPPFAPTIIARPETESADSPTGLDVDLHIPQSQAPEGLATANLKSAVMALPDGLTLNPSAADGLSACSLAQVDLHGPGAAQCPAGSRLGTVNIATPLLDHPLPGSVYLARQGENPFGSLIALYVTVFDPLTGVVVKLPGEVRVDETTGQLTASFRENPQLPFEDFSLDFFGGPRASLTTPSTCGSYTTSADLTPWTTPEGSDAFPVDSFKVTSAAHGGTCPTAEGQMPNAPSFVAGTVTPFAGSYSPFVLKISREDGSQRLRALNMTLPPGLSGRLAGVEECSDAQIVAAQARGGLGEGALELASPSCPPDSEVGLVTVGSGSGSPLYVQGRAYLAGPYKGAPLSLVIITPAIAGPFDLGTVVVRAALLVNEETARITVRSDPIPTQLHGIPLEVRSLAVNMARPRFTLNPTSCEEASVKGEAISALGQSAPLRSPFQVGGCSGLGFNPKVALSLKGGTKRAKHPALKAVVTYPQKGAYANIARAAVTLPASEFIDQNHIDSPCTRVQFNAHICPPASVLGKARAFTPLLDKPLEGPVYFRSNGGDRELPDIVADLNGQVHLVLVGFVDSVHRKGSDTSRIRNTFATVPDAPVSKFVLELNGGKKKGLLVNSVNLCKVSNKAAVELDAQNGKVSDTTPAVLNDCGKREKSRKTS